MGSLIIYEGIHKPELDMINIGSLEVIGVYFSHYTSPVLSGISKASVLVEVSTEVVWTSFCWIISKVKHRDICRLTVSRILVWEDFPFIDLTNIVVRSGILITTDMVRCKVGIAKEQGVYMIPCQSCSTVAIAQVIV